jgi:hypothetical protein
MTIVPRLIANKDLNNSSRVLRPPKMFPIEFLAKVPFLGFAWIPLFTGLFLFGGLIGMLGAWAEEGHPQYRPDEESIVFVSDVGAHLKPLFISTCPGIQI